MRKIANSVIARSSCDEAIQLLLAVLDCFASLAMTWRGYRKILRLVSLHHRRGLSEQQRALFLGADRGLAEIRVDFLGLGIGAFHRRALADGFQPALEMREVV